MKKLLLAIPVLIDEGRVLTSCLEKAFEQSIVKSGEADVFVFLNSKNDEGIIGQVDKFDDGYLVVNEDNLGVAGTWNQAIIEAIRDQYKYVVNMGFDVMLDDKEYLEDFVEYMDNEQLDFCLSSHILFNLWGANALNFKNKIGLFDENFYPGYWEDIDMLIRMHIAENTINFKRGKFSQQDRVTHLQSKTINDHGNYIPHDVWNYSYTRNQLYLKAKWNVMDNETFLKNPTPPKETFQSPFNNIKFQPSFWVLNGNEVIKSKEKWDACIQSYLKENESSSN